MFGRNLLPGFRCFGLRLLLWFLAVSIKSVIRDRRCIPPSSHPVQSERLKLKRPSLKPPCVYIGIIVLFLLTGITFRCYKLYYARLLCFATEQIRKCPTGWLSHISIYPGDFVIASSMEGGAVEKVIYIYGILL